MLDNTHQRVGIVLTLAEIAFFSASPAALRT
jgi:hypothetical protein